MVASPTFRVVGPDDGPPTREFARGLLERCGFPDTATGEAAAPGTLACAVSGGADSLALLVLATEAGCHPVAYHVDHGLRPGSASEVEVVERAAFALGSEVVSLRVDLAPGPNLEARARAARFAVLPAGVATGHTADDQAETVLINLLRGSSAAGLAGMSSGARHPILGLRRSETRAVCREAGLDWFEDPSNAETGPLRNKIRHRLVPELNELSGRDLVPILCRQAELLGDDEALLDELSIVIDPTVARQLAAAPLPLARRAIRKWLRNTTPTPHPPSSATVDRVLKVAAGAVLACEVGGGITVRRRAGRLVIERTGSRPVQ
ncbi:MAG: tRNA lysidine(34) synthetase TilS [Acidimicrobiales bacterium]|jgi:tRNA(Ile)-lysidine synthase